MVKGRLKRPPFFVAHPGLPQAGRGETETPAQACGYAKSAGPRVTIWAGRLFRVLTRCGPKSVNSGRRTRCGRCGARRARRRCLKFYTEESNRDLVGNHSRKSRSFHTEQLEENYRTRS